MIWRAVLGAVGFCSRLPVGTTERSFRAFTDRPVAFVLAAIPIGGLIGIVAAAGVALFGRTAPATAGVWLVSSLYTVTGINHLDGVGDLGDMAAVHGDRRTRQSVLTDTTLGVGGVLALCLVVGGIGAAGFQLAGLAPFAVLVLVLASEIGAKVGIATIACVGTPFHDGLGATVLRDTGRRDLGWALFVAAGVTGLLALVTPAVVLATGAGWAGALLVYWWASRLLGGCNGDVFGGANEIGRVVGLHVGVITWTFL